MKNGLKDKVAQGIWKQKHQEDALKAFPFFVLFAICGLMSGSFFGVLFGLACAMGVLGCVSTLKDYFFHD